MAAFQQDSDYLAAMTHYLAGSWREAASAFAELDSRFPQEAFLKLLRGNVEYSLGNLDTSIDHYRAAVALSPTFGNAYYKLGVCLYRLGRLSEALEAFESVITSGSQSHAMAAYFIGLINVFLGHDDVAETAFAQFHDMSPTSRIADYYLAQIKIKHKDFGAARELLTTLVEDNPEFAELQYMLGTVHYGLHDNTQAIKCFQRALDLNPEDERIKTKLTLLTDVQWP